MEGADDDSALTAVLGAAEIGSSVIKAGGADLGGEAVLAG
jgi:hypothetical protein